MKVDRYICRKHADTQLICLANNFKKSPATTSLLGNYCSAHQPHTPRPSPSRKANKHTPLGLGDAAAKEEGDAE